MSKHKRNDKVMTEEDKKNKRNTSVDSRNYKSQAGQPQDKVTSEHSGGQYHFKKDRLGKVDDRNEGESEKAPDITEPNTEGGPGGSIYEEGNRVPRAGRIKHPGQK